MEAPSQPDERNGAEERWNAVFDKVFAQLRAKHPADEWAIRIVDQLPLPSSKVEEQVEVVVVSESTPDAAAQEGEGGAVVTEELVVVDEVAVVVAAEVPAGGQLQLQAETEPVGESTPTSAEDAVIIEADAQPVEEPVVAVTATVEQQEEEPPVVDVSATLNSSEAEQLVIDDQIQINATNDEGLPKAEEEEVQEETIVPMAVHEQLAEPESSQSAELNQENSHGTNEDRVDGGEHETQSSEPETTSTQENSNNAGTDDQQQQEPEPGAFQGIPDQNHVDQAAEKTTNEEAGITDENQQQVVESVAVQAEETPLESSQPPAEVVPEESATTTTTTTTTDAAVVVLQVPEGDVNTAVGGVEIEITNNLDNETQATPEALAVEALLISVGLIDDQPAAAVLEIESPSAVLVNGDIEGETAKQVEEVLVQAEQVEKQPSTTQQLSASTPRLDADGQPKAAKKPASEGGRKPEWMRRPLVRKGSVGRFLGRMKETMQSKRFGPDRLPLATVPPPELEPPKRPPRRKTLANLDLSRESVSVATSREYSQVDSPLPPKEATPIRETTPAIDKSATLRSTTSERRKRTNSVGRFIGRVLSTKHLNNVDGSPEEAPLLQPAATATSAPAESQTVPASATPTPTPEKTSKVKEQVNQAKEQVNKAKEHVNQVIRNTIRILRPVKNPGSADDSTKTKSVPERPPPPSRPRSPSAEKAPKKDKPIIKSGKVQFHCQKCQHEWSSAKGTVRFEIHMNQVGEGIRQGEVLVRLYGQRCNRCSSDVFEMAEWSEEGVEKVLTELQLQVVRTCYPEEETDGRLDCDERGPRAHQRKLCAACQDGVCQMKKQFIR